MLSKNNIKLIRSLHQKKYRKAHNLFIIEGDKMVNELINSKINIEHIYTTNSNYNLLSEQVKTNQISLITEKELEQISQLATPNNTLAIAKIPQIDTNFIFDNNLSIALDNLQDPGNLGTIIRTANWFGVKTIYCSNNSVDAFNPKVVQSTMGAIFNTNIIYCDLKSLFAEAKKHNIPLYGTTLDGENMYQKELDAKGIIVMGNESSGLSEDLMTLIDEKVFIPTFPANTAEHIESLNVAVATAIVLAEFRRR